MTPEPHAAGCPSAGFLLGHAASDHWEEAAARCLQQIGTVPDDYNLGFLYVADDYAGMLPAILDRFRRATGIQDWVGTLGMGVCATATEYHQTGAISALLCNLPPDSYRLLPPLTDPRLPELAAYTDWLRQHPHHLAVVHGDPRSPVIPQLIQGLARGLPNGYLVGGLTSSRWDEVQIADRVFQGGLSGVVFSDRVRVVTGITQGCCPIAGRHVITDCDRNIIRRIDDRPALDVFFEDIGEILARDLNRIAGYIFAALPLPHSDRGDYLVRNLVGLDTRNRLLAIGDMVEPGQAIQFCRRDGRSAWEDLERMLDDVRTRIQGRPQGALYFSCLGRGPHLFGNGSEELRAIQRHLGDIPLAGFYANGEICHDQLYGYTGVLAVFHD